MQSELDMLLWLATTSLMFGTLVIIYLVVHNAYASLARNMKYVDGENSYVSNVGVPAPTPAQGNVVTLHTTLPHQKNKNLFREIFESAPECVVLQSRDGTIELINHTGLALLEAEQTDSIIGQSVYDLVVEDHCEAYRDMSNQVFLGKQVCLEYEIVTCKGNHRWMSTNAVPLRNAQRKITSLIAITRDITETRVISQQLKTHRNKLQTIIESEPECVKLQDASGIITEMNPAGLSMLAAVRNSDVIGKTIYDFMTPEYVDEYRDLTARVFNGGRGSMEFEVICLKGGRRWLETHAAPLFDNEGKVTALLAITRDIDERKKNEARLYQQQIELAHVCRLSTMGEMSSSLAHELNQPLCAVSSYAESARLLNLSASSELDELLDKIVLQSQRATKIIQNMRDFVRKQAPRPESVSAASIVKNVIDFVERDMRLAMIPVSLQIAAELSPINADRVQIEQVLLNLISNAIQATQELEEGQRSITIQVSPESSEELIFKVCNAGQDISADVVEELFTPFYTTKEAGLGMGLSISRSIVEAHGGRIWYDNVKGYGTCFCFTLPTVDD